MCMYFWQHKFPGSWACGCRPVYHSYVAARALRCCRQLLIHTKSKRTVSANHGEFFQLLRPQLRFAMPHSSTSKIIANSLQCSQSNRTIFWRSCFLQDGSLFNSCWLLFGLLLLLLDLWCFGLWDLIRCEDQGRCMMIMVTIYDQDSALDSTLNRLSAVIWSIWGTIDHSTTESKSISTRHHSM